MHLMDQLMISVWYEFSLKYVSGDTIIRLGLAWEHVHLGEERQLDTKYLTNIVPAGNYMLKLTIETLEQGVKYAQS